MEGLFDIRDKDKDSDNHVWVCRRHFNWSAFPDLPKQKRPEKKKVSEKPAKGEKGKKRELVAELFGEKEDDEGEGPAKKICDMKVQKPTTAVDHNNVLDNGKK